MHDSFLSSGYTIRCKGSLSFSFNDYCTSYLNETFYRNPLSYSTSRCCNCCNCCRNIAENKGGFFYPRYLNGLKQSTLIQRAPHKRVILNGFDQFYGSRFLGNDVGRSCYGDYYERKACGRRWRLGRERFGCVVCEKKSKRKCLCGGREGFDEAEIMISLLSEDIRDECFGLGEGREKVIRKVHVDEGGSDEGKSVRDWKKKVENGAIESASQLELETRTNLREVLLGSEGRKTRVKEKEKKAENGVMESALKFQLKTIRSREANTRKKEDEKRGEEREVLLGREIRKARVMEEQWDNQLRGKSRASQREEEREYLVGENHRSRVRTEESESLSRHEDHLRKVRKDGSSCSSYYSISSGEFESDDEIQVEQHEFEGELYSGTRRDSKGTHDDRHEFKSHGEYSKESGLVLIKDDSHTQFSEASVGVESGWRKESEKKLTDISVKEAESSKNLATKKSGYREEQESGYGIASGSNSKFDDRNEKASMVMNEITKEGHRQTNKAGTRIKYKHFKDTSEAYGADFRNYSSSQKLYSSMEENSSKNASSAQDMRSHHPTAGQEIREDVSKESSQKIAEESKVAEIDARGVSHNSRRSETRMKNFDDHSTGNFYDRKEQHQQVIQSNIQAESRVRGERLIEDSISENISVSQEEADRRSRKQEEKASFIYNSNLKSTEHQLEANSKHVKSSTVQSMKISQESTTKISQESTEVSAPLYSETHISVAPLFSQLEARGSRPAKSPSRLVIEEITAETSTDTNPTLDEWSLELDYYPQALQQEKVSVTRKDEADGKPLKLISHGDAHGSADQLQKASEQHIGEFFQKEKNEISSSEIRKVKESHKEKWETKYDQQNQATVGSHGSGISGSKETDSRHSSLSSRSKGPSDEMWHENEPSIEEPSEEEALVREGTSQNVVFKRSGKSLWNIIADIVHFRWARHENHSTRSKSGRKSSPDQSPPSETWFSGHDPEESADNPVQTDKISSTKGSISIELPKEEKLSSSRGELSHSSSLQAEDKQQGDGFPTSSVSLPKDSSPNAILLPSSESTLNTSITDINPKAEGAHPLHLLPSLQIRRSPTVDQILSAEVSASGSAEQISQPVATALSDDISPDSKDREAKHRKLQRIDQVVKDRFEEWEEAYRLDTEQQKIDEMFMREALTEAKKAADFWEVPVGAVLVQGGKIIARGYNLVEELRDSTAHAEMICIREASNILRSWRLSESTLYVTLEPCPMCAGAILQARIDTVVWGAPNKLLGADGSWIRLFPNGEGASGSESSDKPAAPVHPFHPKMVIRRGVLATECANAMQQFFQRRRKREKEKKPNSATPPSCLPISHHPSKFLSKMHDAFHILICL